MNLFKTTAVTLPKINTPRARMWCNGGLYKALSKNGNPSLGMVLKVLKALGLKFTPQVA